MGQPLVFPHGVTVYNPEKCWSGYTIVPLINDGVLLFDMNGNEVRRWNMHAMPPKLLPGGYVMGLSGYRHPDYGMQDGVNLIEIDYDGNIVWEFDHFENIDDPGRDHRWMARQHHDYQREGNPVGYYVPGMDAKPLSGNTLILVHQTIHNPKISDKKLLDDAMIEVDWDGNILWKWSISEHFDELGFDEAAKNVLFRDPNLRASDGGVGDYLHVNCMSYLGPNKWYDQGDMRFKPDNIIFDCREANILAILDKETGKIVWRIGPDFNATPELKKLGWIIGQHHFHMIPKGLPGEGNLMVFDNGGWRLRDTKPIISNRHQTCIEGLQPCAGVQSCYIGSDMETDSQGTGPCDSHGCQQILQPLCQQRTAPSQRQYPGNRRLRRQAHRGNTGP